MKKIFTLLMILLVITFSFNMIIKAQDEWFTYEIIPDNGGGRASIAIDSNGNPHICYSSASTYGLDQGGDLNYARWFGCKWEIETIYDEGRVFDLSFVLDENDNAHISFGDFLNGGLKYARWMGNEWQITTVDDEEGVGGQSSISLDSNNYPHIGYRAHDGDENYTLKYAKWTSTNWSITTVDDLGGTSEISIAVDSNDFPHVCYNNNSRGVLTYARWNGSDWNNVFITGEGEIRGSAMVLDRNDHAHISYFDSLFPLSSSLKYSEFYHSTNWQNETIDTFDWSYLSTSITLDRNETPHISYIADTSPRYARLFFSHWVIHYLDDEAAYESISIALDEEDEVHICYFFVYDLKYTTTKQLETSSETTSLILMISIVLIIVLVIPSIYLRMRKTNSPKPPNQDFPPPPKN